AGRHHARHRPPGPRGDDRPRPHGGDVRSAARAALIDRLELRRAAAPVQEASVWEVEPGELRKLAVTDPRCKQGAWQPRLEPDLLAARNRSRLRTRPHSNNTRDVGKVPAAWLIAFVVGCSVLGNTQRAHEKRTDQEMAAAGFRQFPADTPEKMAR